MRTDLDRLEFLLETEAAFHAETLSAYGDDQRTYRTNYIGSKQKLIEWIWKNTPDGIETVADAFSGSGVVGYMFKQKGLKVQSNDRLRYSYHTARAIIENGGTTLSDSEVESLLKPNSKAGTFVRDHFKDTFYSDDVNGAIDNVRANIDGLTGFKRDIALAALGRACLNAKGGFGHFTAVSGERSGTADQFGASFTDAVKRFNDLVFDNGKQCSVTRKDVLEFLPNVDADLAYFDPPYATEFSTTNYEKAYHFIEGLMCYWDGMTIDAGSKVRAFQGDHQTVTKGNARQFFERFLSEAAHIDHWLISYRDHSYPNEEEMKRIIAANGRSSRMESHDHKYSITSKRGDASNAQELLFVCAKGAAAEKKAAASLTSRADRNVIELGDADGPRLVIEIKVL